MYGEKRTNKLKDSNIVLIVHFTIIGTLLASLFFMWAGFSNTIEEYQLEHIENAKQGILKIIRKESSQMYDELDELSKSFVSEIYVQHHNTIIYTSNGITDLEQLDRIYDNKVVYKELYYEGNFTIWISMLNIDTNDIINKYLLITLIIVIIVTSVSLTLIYYIFRSFTKPFSSIMELIESMRNGEKMSSVSKNNLNVISMELISLYNKITFVKYKYKSVTTIYEEEKQINTELVNEQMQYLSTVLHDIKTPLASIDVSRYTLERNIKADEKEMESLHNIKTQTERTLNMIITTLNNVVGDYENIYFEEEEVSVKEIVEEYLRDCNILIGAKKLKLEINLSQKTLVTNKMKCSLIIANVLSNIIQYSKEETVIKIIEEGNKITFTNVIGKNKSSISTGYGIKQIAEYSNQIGINVENKIQNHYYMTTIYLGDTYA